MSRTLSVLAIAAIALTPKAIAFEYPAVICATDAVNLRASMTINSNTTHPRDTLRAYPPLSRPVVDTAYRNQCFRVADNDGNGTWVGGYSWVLLHTNSGTLWAAEQFFQEADY